MEKNITSYCFADQHKYCTGYGYDQPCDCSCHTPAVQVSKDPKVKEE